MATPSLPIPEDTAARFFAALTSVYKFDELEVRHVIRTLVTLDSRATCFRLLYQRAVSNVGSLLKLNHPKDFQAHAILSRTLFELDMDLKLIDVIPHAIEKMVAFVDVDKLNCARKVEQFKAAHPTSTKDDKLEMEFITNCAARIDADQARLWPPRTTGGRLRRPEHWSGKTIKDRAYALGPAYEEKYEVEFPRMNWHAHAGVTGVANFKADSFPKMATLAIISSTKSYKSILETVIKEFKIDKFDGSIMPKMKAAEMMPFTNTPEEAQELMP